MKTLRIAVITLSIFGLLAAVAASRQDSQNKPIIVAGDPIPCPDCPPWAR